MKPSGALESSGLPDQLLGRGVAGRQTLGHGLRGGGGWLPGGHPCRRRSCTCSLPTNIAWAVRSHTRPSPGTPRDAHSTPRSLKTGSEAIEEEVKFQRRRVVAAPPWGAGRDGGAAGGVVPAAGWATPVEVAGVQAQCLAPGGMTQPLDGFQCLAPIQVAQMFGIRSVSKTLLVSLVNYDKKKFWS